MMGKDTNLSNLVEAARVYGEAYASNRKWRATYDGWGSTRCVRVYHYDTLMITVPPSNNWVRISEGYGSVSDKQGITKITRGLTVVKLVEPEDSYEPVKGWQPSIRVEDTYL